MICEPCGRRKCHWCVTKGFRAIKAKHWTFCDCQHRKGKCVDDAAEEAGVVSGRDNPNDIRRVAESST